MKVKQIVGEHKKGFRANIYQRKKQTSPQPAQVAPTKPGAEKKGVAEGSGPKEKQKTPYRDINSPEYRKAADKQKQQMAKDAAAEPGKKLADKIAKKGVAEDDAGDLEQRMIAKIEKEKQRLAKLKQTDPEAYKREMAKRKTSSRIPPVSTFEEQGLAEDMAPQVYKVTKNDPNTGVTLAKPDGTQLILPPDKVNAIAANPNDPNKYLLNPDAVTQGQQGQPPGPELGREVEVNDQMEIPTAEGNDESGDVGGDPTDQYIDDVVDQDFEKAQNRDSVSVLKHLAGLK